MCTLKEMIFGKGYVAESVDTRRMLFFFEIISTAAKSRGDKTIKIQGNLSDDDPLFVLRCAKEQCSCFYSALLECFK